MFRCNAIYRDTPSTTTPSGDGKLNPEPGDVDREAMTPDDERRIGSR
jgi:hypothetical protein